jgi:purine-binding chemotaxis protein CheW
MGAGERDQKRAELQRRLRQLEADLIRTQAELAALGPGQKLPGLYLVFDVAGYSAALSVAQVSEIIRLVECTALPKAPVHVLGTFIYRGEPMITINLACFLGVGGEPRLDAHMVVLEGARPVALVVDRVRSMVEAPVLAEPSARDGRSDQWYASKLVSGLCRVGNELVPLINIDPLLEGVTA